MRIKIVCHESIHIEEVGFVQFERKKPTHIFFQYLIALRWKENQPDLSSWFKQISIPTVKSFQNKTKNESTHLRFDLNGCFLILQGTFFDVKYLAQTPD